MKQLLYNAPAIPRLGMPEYNWWNEALHGVARSGRATVFPQSITLAASWDEDLMLELATIISDEARAKFHDYQRRGMRGIYQGLTFWSPNINIFRDPRWGRGHETYGEDPYLTGRMGLQFVKGMPAETLTFELYEDDFSMINKEGRRVIEPGRFTVFVGGRQPGYRSPNDTGFSGLVSADIIIE